MERTNVTTEDEGKRVVDSNGTTVGIVTKIEAGAAYVDVDPGITDTIRSKLGWGDANEGDYVLQRDQISAITDEEIRLKGGL